MQIAIRRALPAARQRLVRPQRFGPPTSTRLRLVAQARCLSHSPASLRPADDSPLPKDSSVEGTESTKDSNEPTAKKDGAAAAAESPAATEGGDGFIPEVPHEEMVNSILEAQGGGDTGGDRPPARRGRPAGAKSRTTTRKVVPIPKPELPSWFVQRGVVLKEDNQPGPRASSVGIYSEPPPETAAESPPSHEGSEKTVESTRSNEGTPKTIAMAESTPAEFPAPEEAIPETSPTESEPAAGTNAAESETVPEMVPEMVPETKERYHIHESVWNELTAYVRTGLLLPHEIFADGLAATKSHCLLHLPKDGGMYYLDAVAEKLAAEVGADLVRIDTQDVAEIAGDFLGDSRHISRSDISPIGIRSLAYDTQITTSRSLEAEEDEALEEDEELYEDEEDEPMATTAPIPGGRTGNFSLLGALPPMFQQLFRSGRAVTIPLASGEFPFPGTQTKEQMLDRMNEKKLATLLEVMISAAQTKRLTRGMDDMLPPDTASSVPNKTIIHIRDYREIEDTTAGDALLKMLHTIVQDRRRQGERILILGTTSTEENLSSYSKSGVKGLQARSGDEAFERTIVVPPVFSKTENAIFEEDRLARTREVNIRHLRDVIRRRGGVGEEAAALYVPEGWHFKPDVEIPGIDKVFWSFDRVHRVATVALGKAANRSSPEITASDILEAVNIIDRSDNIKFQWASQEQEYLKERERSDNPEPETKKSKVLKDLTNHEKKLIGGIIDPKDIHTGFSSVRAPVETIDAMKTLTSLSLVRPEAFKYGVLATDRIPGVLLYGPPGTGKTLLARAVAKESGATVLEVSGGDIFNMYVGEGEKNVKAIFSLAKKLSPCVVFIDEADAIFGSRQSFSSRSSHREIINQFLKEWADMDSTAFIMVATNRPFDLDDAILRRLPRRILIDLPTAEDRLEILKIHLASEILDDTVDLKKIADESTLYSGSDLKNLCVSAALACVKEENAEFVKTGKYPEKRILSKRHFDKAAHEITASISDDMGSLGLIRKFDEKYGERIGRKKKPKNAWGFELGQSEVAQKGEGRVRVN